MASARSHARVAAAPCPFPFGELSPPIAAQIRAEGVSTCGDWITLGRRRMRIFGVVSSQVRKIDVTPSVAADERSVSQAAASQMLAKLQKLGHLGSDRGTYYVLGGS